VCERQWKPLSEEERYQRRQEIAVPILAEFHQWLQGQSVNVLPKSKIGEAVSYALNQWDAWVRYCEAGYLSIDNNLSEQMVKPCAMGRKAWLFLGSENGGATAAILYSLTASAKANRVHPYFYLRDVFDRLPEVIHDPLILPHLQAACEAAPLSDPQKLALLGCRRAPQYLDLLRCHPRVLAERFLQNQIEPEVVAAFTELLPDRWLAAHPEYRLEINRSTGIPVGMERIDQLADRVLSCQQGLARHRRAIELLRALPVDLQEQIGSALLQDLLQAKGNRAAGQAVRESPVFLRQVERRAPQRASR